jgi:four helix bundle protein
MAGEIERGDRDREMTFKFERFEAWRRAIAFADAMFDVADGLPQKDRFSLGEQMRRAALSVPTNLAEGSGRDNLKERRYLYGVVKGSLYEVVSLLVMMGKRGHLERQAHREFYREADELAAMIAGAIASTYAQS